MTLRIVHPECDLSEFDYILGEPATRSWVAGSERLTPTGRKIVGTNPNSYRAYSIINENTQVDFADAIESVVGKLEFHKDRINEILDSEGIMELFISVIDTNGVGDNLHWALLNRLGFLKVSLSLS